MRYLILVRHGKSVPTADAAANQWQLADDAKVGLQTLSAELKQFEPALVVSSEEPKAIDSAEMLANLLSIDFVDQIDAFNEQDNSGTPYFVSVDKFHAAVHRLFEQPGELVYGNETAYEARGRFAGGVYELVDEQPNGSIILVSHGRVMALFAALSMGQPALQVWRTIQQLGMPMYIALTLPDLQFVAIGPTAT